MALNKIQHMIANLSKDPKVKKVISDVQSATKDIQSKLHNLKKEDAVKTYKKLIKQVSSKENELQKEVKTFITKVEKNLNVYKKQAAAKRAEFEKMLKTKGTASNAKPAARKAKKAAPKRKTTARK